MSAVGVAALLVDRDVAGWFLAGNLPGPIEKLCGLAEVFGHGLGVAMILATIAIVDRGHARNIPRLAAASLGAGLIADLVKMTLARTRPGHFDLAKGVSLSFGAWLPGLSVDSELQSFPSAHAATAVGLAICLGQLYPRGRHWFALLAALVAMQRLSVGAHFLSDVCLGAAIGMAFGGAISRGQFGGRFWQRLEGTDACSLAAAPLNAAANHIEPRQVAA